MSKNTSQNPSEKTAEAPAQAPATRISRARIAQRLSVLAWASLRSVISTRFASMALLILIVLQLAILGTGVSSRMQEYVLRLEALQNRTMEQAKQRASEREEQELIARLQGGASIGTANQHADIEEEAQQAAPQGVPVLQPRSAEEILEQDTNYLADLLSQEASVLTNSAAAATQQEGESITVELNPEAEQHIRDGVTAMVAGDMRRCILQLEQALALSPKHPALLYYYGMAYDKLRNPDKAREYYLATFNLRDAAGPYFKKAARRLTYGFTSPTAMRGKLSFGPHQMRLEGDEQQGEEVQIILPVLLAPGEEVKPDDIHILIQCFELSNGRKVEFAHNEPSLAWENPAPTWDDWEERLVIHYSLPPLTQEELDIYGELKYYGFTAKLYYKGEPLDCISSPSALILHEERLKNRREAGTNAILPDDGLEEAMPAAAFPDTYPEAFDLP